MGIIILMLTNFPQTTRGAELVIVINTLECSNYYRSAPLLTNLKQNFDITFIFPEYESRIATKYLDQKFNLNWKEYQISYNDSLYNLYRKNKTSECVYFPNESKYPLFSFPLSKLNQSFKTLRNIPGKLKVDTIAVDPRFLFTADMSFSFDSNYFYILDAQFGAVLQMDKKNHRQRFINLADSFDYADIQKTVLSNEELKNHLNLESTIKDPQGFIPHQISFSHLTCHNNLLLINASVSFYKKGEYDRIGIFTRDFILRINPFNLKEKECIPYRQPKGEIFVHAYGPVFATGDTLHVPILIPQNSPLDTGKKYLLASYTLNNAQLEFTGLNPHTLLPEEHTRLNINYNYLSHSTYHNYFSFPYTRTIYQTNGPSIQISLLPEIDTLAGSEIYEIRTNYMKLSFAVQYPLVNFLVLFNDGKIKLFSYDYTNNLPLNQIDMPVKLRTHWPEEDFFTFIDINSFVHINLRNQYLLNYYW